MLIGYARTSKLEQKAGLEGQERELKAVGCERLYVEQVSSGHLDFCSFSAPQLGATGLKLSGDL